MHRLEEINVFPQLVAVNGWAGLLTVAVGMLTASSILSTKHRELLTDGPSS